MMEKGTRMKTDRGTRILLGAIVILLGIIAVQLSESGFSILPRASAQIPDTGLQRVEQLKETKRTNELLEKILGHLQTKAVKVQIERAEKADDPARKRSAP